MAYAAKANTNKKYRHKNQIILLLMTILAIASLIMLIFSFATGMVFFGIAWIIAFILLASYVLIRFNTVFTTYLATDKSNIYMNSWTNDFFSYDVTNKIKILSEFIPAKTKLIKIPIDSIESIVIGTKNSIKRYTDENSLFRARIAPYEKTKDFAIKKAINSMDLFYVATNEDSSFFMPIEHFSSRDVARVLQFVQRVNPNIMIKVNSKNFRMNLKEK